MDGCKKIKSTNALIGLFLAIALIGCRSQHFDGVNLFVDSNMLSDKDNKQSSNVDTVFVNYRNDFLKTIVVNDSTNIFKNTFIDISSQVVDSLMINRETQNNGFKDSVNLIAFKTENELKTSIDSITLGDDNFIVKDSAFYRNKHNQIVEQQLLIDSLRSKIDELQTVDQNIRLADTVNITKEIPLNIPLDTNKGQSALHQELFFKNDTIQQFRNQLRNQQSTVQKTDTVTIIKEVAVTNPTPDTKAELFALQQEQYAKDKTIQQLRNQLMNQQSTVQKTDTITIIKEVAVTNPTPDTKAELFALQQEQYAKNDTIQQLINQQSTVQKTDTITIIKEVADTKPTPDTKAELFALQQEQYAKDKTIQQLRNQLINQQSTVQKTDTITISSYYNIGKIRPENETELLNQIKSIIQNSNVERVVLSGHTDITGNSEINKKITSQRLEYILSKIKIYFPLELIFIQNFADAFASDTIVPEERRVKIQIFIK